MTGRTTPPIFKTFQVLLDRLIGSSQLRVNLIAPRVGSALEQGQGHGSVSRREWRDCLRKTVALRPKGAVSSAWTALEGDRRCMRPMIVFSHSGNCLFLALLGYKSFLTESENGAFLDVKLIPLGRPNLHFDRPSQELLPHPCRQELFYVLPRGLRAPCHPTLPDQDARGDGHHWLIPHTMCWFSAAASTAAAPYFTCWNEGSIE